VKVGESDTKRVLVRASKPFKVVGVDGAGDGISVELPAAGAAVPVQVVVVKFEPKAAGAVARHCGSHRPAARCRPCCRSRRTGRSSRRPRRCSTWNIGAGGEPREASDPGSIAERLNRGLLPARSRATGGDPEFTSPVGQVAVKMINVRKAITYPNCAS
jgi:hypothetical protein